MYFIASLQCNAMNFPEMGLFIGKQDSLISAKFATVFFKSESAAMIESCWDAVPGSPQSHTITFYLYLQLHPRVTGALE